LPGFIVESTALGVAANFVHLKDKAFAAPQVIYC